MGLDSSQSSVSEVNYNFVFQLVAKSLVYSNGHGSKYNGELGIIYVFVILTAICLTNCSLRSSLGNFIPVCFPLPFLLENMLIILPVIILLHLLPAWR